MIPPTNLARYAEANAALSAPAKFELRVVFMGDSITDGWVSPEYGGFFPGKQYVDRGISGQTTPQMLVRFRQDVIALHPKVVVILAGTNDIAGNTGPTTLEAIEDNFVSMAELARANGIPVDNVYYSDASKQTKRVSANVSGLFGTTRITLNDNLLNRTSPAGRSSSWTTIPARSSSPAPPFARWDTGRSATPTPKTRSGVWKPIPPGS